MPNYEQGTLGKLVVQDWDVVSGYPDEPLLYILTKQQAAALVPLVPPLKWRTRWQNAPSKDIRDAFVAETMFNLMNPITCAMLQACLQELFDAQTDSITNIITNVNNFGTSNPGQPMTTEELEENLAGASNPTCNYDILWAQCLFIVQYTNESITDTLEKIEAASNVNELAGLADTIPLVGWVVELFGAELATDTINYFQEAIAESYAAQYTEAVENELAAALFCMANLDCNLNVNLVYDVLYNRVLGIVPDNPGEMIDLLEMLAGIDFDGTNVVDLMFWFCWAGVKLASFLIEPVTTESFEFLMGLAVNDASPDWVYLTDCGSDWNYQLDSTTDPVWVDVPDVRGEGTIGGNVLTQTTVVSFGQDVTGISFLITFPTVQTITATYIKQLAGTGIEASVNVNTFLAYYDASDNPIGGGALPKQDGEWEHWQSGVVAGVKKIQVEYAFIGTDQTVVWQPVQIFGFGINPFV